MGFIELVRSVGTTGEGGPILVHCSAGLGRSGVFVAVHSSLGTQECEGRRVDLETTVREMRKARGGMIQTSEQFRFCFEAIAEALDPILPPEVIPELKPSQSLKGAPRDQGNMSLPPRPLSHPLSGQEVSGTQRKRRYFVPPYPPPKEEATPPTKRVSSPLPPSSSPPPPLTPSTSGETTPTKSPFPETSPEATPTKHGVSAAPDIVVIPPTRQASLSSINREFGSVDRKTVRKEVKSFEGKRRRTSREREAERETKREPERDNSQSTEVSAPTTLAAQTSPLSPKESTENRGGEGEREDPMTEEELKKTLEGFKVPPPRNLTWNPSLKRADLRSGMIRS